MKGTRVLLPLLICLALLAACSRATLRESVATPAPVINGDLKLAAPAPAQPGRGGADGTDQSPAAGQGTAGLGTGAGSVTNLPQERMVIKTATLVVRVKDVPAAFARAVQLADTHGGYVQSSTQSEEGGPRADVTIRVPPNGFLPLIASLEALGVTTTKTITGEDVTQEYYDLSAELDNQTQVRSRLFQLLRQSVKVTDAIAVEEQLERVGANINRIQGRMKYLQTMTGLSTVSVSLTGEERAASEGFINWYLVGHGFFRAAQILVGVFFVLLQCLVVAIPLGVVGGAVAWGIVRLVREVRRRRDGAAGAGSGAGAGAASRSPRRPR